MAKKSTSKNYGVGEFDANPFFGGEETEFKGRPYTIMSPHGSEFGVGYLPIDETNNMADVIEETEWHGGAGIKLGRGGKKGRK
jgi:hypothetical protein